MSNATFRSTHIQKKDVNGDGIDETIAVVKEWPEGDMSYILVGELGMTDKRRLKAILSSVHADKYPLWQLLGQNKLSNGMNALDFFHRNYIKMYRDPNSTADYDFGATLDDVKADDTVNKGIADGFTDPTKASSDGTQDFGF